MGEREACPLRLSLQLHSGICVCHQSAENSNKDGGSQQEVGWRAEIGTVTWDCQWRCESQLSRMSPERPHLCGYDHRIIRLHQMLRPSVSTLRDTVSFAVPTGVVPWLLFASCLPSSSVHWMWSCARRDHVQKRNHNHRWSYTNQRALVWIFSDVSVSGMLSSPSEILESTGGRFSNHWTSGWRQYRMRGATTLATHSVAMTQIWVIHLFMVIQETDFVPCGDNNSVLTSSVVIDVNIPMEASEECLRKKKYLFHLIHLS